MATKVGTIGRRTRGASRTTRTNRTTMTTTAATTTATTTLALALLRSLALRVRLRRTDPRTTLVVTPMTTATIPIVTAGTPMTMVRLFSIEILTCRSLP